MGKFGGPSTQQTALFLVDQRLSRIICSEMFNCSFPVALSLFLPPSLSPSLAPSLPPSLSPSPSQVVCQHLIMFRGGVQSLSTTIKGAQKLAMKCIHTGTCIHASITGIYMHQSLKPLISSTTSDNQL